MFLDKNDNRKYQNIETGPTVSYSRSRRKYVLRLLIILKPF